MPGAGMGYKEVATIPRRVLIHSDHGPQRLTVVEESKGADWAVSSMGPGTAAVGGSNRTPPCIEYQTRYRGYKKLMKARSRSYFTYILFYK